MATDPNQLDDRAEFTRFVARVVIQITAHQMAVRQLLYDAGLANEGQYQKAYDSIFQGHFAAIDEALEKADAARVNQVLGALLKTPYRT